MLNCIRFEALLNTDGDPDCPWPTQEREGNGFQGQVLASACHMI